MAKKVVVKQKDGTKKIKVIKNKPKKKRPTITRIPADEKPKPPKAKEKHKTYKVLWYEVENTVNDDSGDASELRVFVRIMAFDGKGNTILDEDGKNKAILEWEKLPKAVRKIAPKPWTFIEGSENSPLELKQGEAWAENKKLFFKFPANDAKAKIVIWVDAIEYDDDAPIPIFGGNPNDFYDVNSWDRKVSEIHSPHPADIVIREESARLTFRFMVYEEK